jgi:hypothetical protein
VNGLAYDPLKNKNLVNVRKQIKYYPEQTTRTGGSTMRVRIPTSNAHIYGPNCSLLFTLVPSEAKEGVGEAKAYARLSKTTVVSNQSRSNKTFFNLIRDFKIRSLSGRELDETRNVNDLIAMRLKYKCQEDYLKTTGNLFGYNIEQGDGKTENTLNNRRVCLPLHLLSGFFDQQTMIPSQLGGMDIEIVWENATKAFTWGSGGAITEASYEVQQIEVVVDAYMYTDEVQQKLNVMASNGGLFYSWNSWYHHPRGLSGNDNSVDINKSVSLLTYAMSRVKLSANDQKAEEDSFDGIAYDVSRFRWRLGAQHYPEHDIKDSVEAYMTALFSCNVFSDCMRPPTVNLSDFEASEHVMSLELERNSTVGNTGQPTNNSRQLNLDFRSGTDLSDHQLITGLEYLKVAAIGLNGAVSVVE